MQRALPRLLIACVAERVLGLRLVACLAGKIPVASHSPFSIIVIPFFLSFFFPFSEFSFSSCETAKLEEPSNRGYGRDEEERKTENNVAGFRKAID